MSSAQRGFSVPALVVVGLTVISLVGFGFVMDYVDEKSKFTEKLDSNLHSDVQWVEQEFAEAKKMVKQIW